MAEKRLGNLLVIFAVLAILVSSFYVTSPEFKAKVDEGIQQIKQVLGVRKMSVGAVPFYIDENGNEVDLIPVEKAFSIQPFAVSKITGEVAGGLISLYDPNSPTGAISRPFGTRFYYRVETTGSVESYLITYVVEQQVIAPDGTVKSRQTVIQKTIGPLTSLPTQPQVLDRVICGSDYPNPSFPSDLLSLMTTKGKWIVKHICHASISVNFKDGTSDTKSGQAVNTWYLNVETAESKITVFDVFVEPWSTS